jgi:hypothetical protein
MTQSKSKKLNRDQPSVRSSAPLARHLLHHLDGYQLAACATGVALLACSCPADAAPICGSLSVTLPRTETYSFNPAHEKVAPFDIAHTFNEISSHTQSQMARAFFTPNTPDAKTMLSTNGLPVELAAGVSIGPGGKFGKGAGYGLLFGYYYRNRLTGNFPNNQSGYVGFQFSQSGQIHYGWLRVRVANLSDNYPALLLSEFGYESAPNTAITAGSCAASANAMPASVSLPESSAEEQKSPTASLGLLALGSEGLPLWRQKILP